MSEPLLHVLSLGAGVQSTTVALMAAKGLIRPMPTAAIFADTQAEPRAVYEHLSWLEPQLPFPVYHVTAGSLREEILGAAAGTNRMDARPPFFVETGGMLHRQCTQDYKILPIHRKIRELAGVVPRSHGPKTAIVIQWIGISLDEAHRMKPSRIRWIESRWPLVEANMTRWDCLQWLAAHGYPQPPKSACTFCPYHDDATWRALRDQAPEDWQDAVRVDQAIRNGVPTGREPSKWYVHRSLRPLDQVDLSTAEDHGQLSMFGNECEGLCGV